MIISYKIITSFCNIKSILGIFVIRKREKISLEIESLIQFRSFVISNFLLDSSGSPTPRSSIRKFSITLFSVQLNNLFVRNSNFIA